MRAELTKGFFVMATRVVGARSRGVLAVEILGTVHRACACGEPNPSVVACARCGTFNYSGHPCRNCHGPGDLADPWTVCPSCGRPAVTESGLLTAWYRSPLKQLGTMFREWRAKRSRTPWI